MRLFFTTVLFLFLALGCSNKKAKAPSAVSSGENLEVAESGGDQYVDKRPKVSAYMLDDAEFRVNGLTVGLQDYFSSDSPAIMYFLPEQADYIELIRCRKDVIVSAGFEVLSNVEVGTSSVGEETSIFRSNDFWAAAAVKPGCSVIAKNYGDRDVFLDGATPDGGWRYIIRACVARGRMTDTEELGDRTCSRQVTSSPVLDHYINKRLKQERETLQEAMDSRNKIDALGRSIYFITKELSLAWEECYKTERERAEDVNKRNKMFAVIGTGLSIGAALYAPYAGGAATGATGAATSTVATSATAAPAGFDWKGAFQSTWGKVQDASGSVSSGSGLGAALAGLAAKTSDYPRTCTYAKDLDRNNKFKIKQIEAEHEIFAGLMDAAESKRADRIELEGN